MREQIVKEALSWVGTPFHHAARVRGEGVDCINLLAAVYANVGLIPDVNIDFYPLDWNLHEHADRFLKGIEQFADELPADEPPLPGDIAVFKYGRHVGHGGVVIEWPLICHAWLDARMVTTTEVDTGPLRKRLCGFYRVRGVV